MLVSRACDPEIARISSRRRPRSGATFPENTGALQLIDRLASIEKHVGLAPKFLDGDVVAQGIYNKSLLYIVSAFCDYDPNDDMPLVGMQRYWSGGPPYCGADLLAVSGTITTDRTVWAPTADDAPEGYRSQATRHGGMPHDLCTNESICSILKNGF